MLLTVGLMTARGELVLQYRIQGIDAELLVLAEDIDQEPALHGVCKVEIRSVSAQGDERLQQGVLAEMAITVASGVLTTAVTEALRLVQRVQDRGAVVVEQPDTEHETERPDAGQAS